MEFFCQNLEQNLLLDFQAWSSCCFLLGERVQHRNNEPFSFPIFFIIHTSVEGAAHM